jgi:hypothetical protein
MADDFNTAGAAGIQSGDREEVVRVVRTHWLTALGPLLVTTVIFLVPFFFLWPLFRLGAWGVAAFTVLLTLAFGLLVRAYYRWYRTSLTLTTARLVWVEQRGLFDRTVSEIAYGNLHDVAYHRRGFWATLAHFGTLQLRFGSGTNVLELRHLPEPDELQRLILQLKAAGATLATAGRGAWWEDRLAAMDDEERRVFLQQVRDRLGEETWRDLFRPPARHGQDESPQ